jgi:hypothetical protein
MVMTGKCLLTNVILLGQNRGQTRWDGLLMALYCGAFLVFAITLSGCGQQPPAEHRTTATVRTDLSKEYRLVSPSGNPVIVALDRDAFAAIEAAIATHEGGVPLKLVTEGKATLVESGATVQVESFGPGELVTIRLLAADIQGEHSHDIAYAFSKFVVASDKPAPTSHPVTGPHTLQVPLAPEHDVLIFTDRAACVKSVLAAATHNEDLLNQLYTSGRANIYPAGLKVYLLHYGTVTEPSQVRILTGPHTGEIGYVPSEWIQ